MNKYKYDKYLKQWNKTLELINSYNLNNDSELISKNFIQFNYNGIHYCFTRPVEWVKIPLLTRTNNFKYPKQETEITFNTFKKHLIDYLDNLKYWENLNKKHKASI